MPIEFKPLFHPEVIRQQVQHFTLPESVSDFMLQLQKWADLIDSGKVDALNEKQLSPDFLTDFFIALLGDTGPVSGGDHDIMSRENLVQLDGQWADAMSGHHGGQGSAMKWIYRGGFPPG